MAWDPAEFERNLREDMRAHGGVPTSGPLAGSPLMVLDRIVLALDGRPIEWRMGWCHLGDRYYLAEMV